MIPTYPEFKPLEWSDPEEYIKYTYWLAPHSDFNFVSLWAWDIKETMKLSILNDNLVILVYGFITDKHYLTFAGKNKIMETAHELIKYSKENYGVPMLKFVPEEVAKGIIDSGLVATVDESNCDYVVLVSDFAESDLLTKSHGCTGQQCRRFLQLYPEYKVKVCAIKDADKNELKNLFLIWAEHKNLNVADFPEYKAFERYIQLKDDNIKVISIYVDNILVGFQICEILSKEYATSEFMKFDINYKRICQVLLWKTCEFLEKEGITYLNMQVDLGKVKLRASKEHYNSKIFLRRYIVEQIENGELRMENEKIDTSIKTQVSSIKMLKKKD